MEQRRGSEAAKEWKPMRRGWCLGEETFREELLEQVRSKGTENHSGAELIEAVEQKAERIVREELKGVSPKQSHFLLLTTKAFGD
jgi:hypothetical protein